MPGVRFVTGDMQIESAPRQGTTIVVSIPLPEYTL